MTMTGLGGTSSAAVLSVSGDAQTLVHVPPRAGALLERTDLDRVFDIDDDPRA